MKKHILIIAVILLISLMFSACSNKNNINIVKNNTKIVKTKNLKPDKLVKHDYCKEKNQKIINYSKQYYIKLKNNLKYNNKTMLYHDFITYINSLKINNCKNINVSQIKHNIFNSSKRYFIKSFLYSQKDLFIQYDNTLQKDLKKLILSYQNNITNIAKNYSNEINSFTPFTTDEEIWDEYIEKPLDKMMNNINNDFIQIVDLDQIEFLATLYNKFFDYCLKNNLIFEKKSNPNILFKTNNYYQRIYHNIDKSEESAWWNSIVGLVEWTPIVGDVLVISDFAFDINLKSNKNFKKAMNYIILNINDYQNDKLKDISNNLKAQEVYALNYYKNLLEYEEEK